MLSITRRSGEEIVVIDRGTGEQMTIIARIQGNQIRFQMQASQRFQILRKELHERPVIVRAIRSDVARFKQVQDSSNEQCSP